MMPEGKRRRGGLTDLTVEAMDFPDLVLLDTTIVASLFLGAGSEKSGAQIQWERANAVYEVIGTHGTVGCIARQTVVELAHLVAIQEFKVELRQNREAHLAALRRRYPGRRDYGWPDLMKVYDQPFVTAARKFDTFCTALRARTMLFLDPIDLGDTPGGMHYTAALGGEMRRQRLDSADAAILLDARRAGIDAIVAFDTDLQRASRDFHIFTWL